MIEHRLKYNGHKVPADLSHFWVITVISNPYRYERRYELYFRFARMCEDAGVNLITVEQPFGDREYMVTDPTNPRHLQVRSHEILWLKENMIDLGIAHAKRLDPKVNKVMWCDSDCRPTAMPEHWFSEVWHYLEIYQFVQCWEYLINLDRKHNAETESQESFMSSYVKNGCPNPEEFKKAKDKDVEYPYGHSKFGRPGLAWAANVDALNSVGGLIDFAILGAGDWYMAHALIGSLAAISGEYKKLSPYSEKLFDWQEKCTRWIKRDVGYVPGTLLHDNHGNKINRRYPTRGKILYKNGYNPNTDIKYDSQGLLQLETWETRQIKMLDQIRAYFDQRNENDIY
jgi:hypothetical protein